MKAKILAFGLALATVSSAWAMSFKANIPNNNVPKLLMTGKLPAITSSAIGDTTIRVKRMCGDGDVAHFASESPNFKFVAHETTKIKSLIGVWVTEEGSITPNARNWIPVGYKDLDIPVGSNSDWITQGSDFLNVNRGDNSGKNASKLLGPEIYHVISQAKQSFGSNKNYKVYAGMFVCHSPDQGSSLVPSSDPSFSLKPGPVDITHSLMATTANNGIHKLAKSTIDNIPTIGGEAAVGLYFAGLSRVNVGIASGSYKLRISNEELDKSAIDYNLGITGEVVQGQSYDLARKIIKLDYPAYTGTNANEELVSYKQLMQDAAGSDFSKLSSLASNTTISSQIDSCSALGISVSKNAPNYDWENFPLNLSCKFLYGKDDKTEFASAYSDLFAPSSVPSVSEFENLKNKVATRLYTAALMEAGQKAIKVSSALAVERPNCFIADSSGNSYINEIVYSSPIKFSQNTISGSVKWVAGDAGSSNYTVPSAHPESLFALNDHVGYSASKDMSVFGMAINGKGSQGAVAPEIWNQIKTSWGISLPLLPLSNGTDEFKEFDADSMQKAINIDVRIRSVGGQCTMYC